MALASQCDCKRYMRKLSSAALVLFLLCFLSRNNGCAGDGVYRYGYGRSGAVVSDLFLSFCSEGAFWIDFEWQLYSSRSDLLIS